MLCALIARKHIATVIGKVLDWHGRISRFITRALWVVFFKPRLIFIWVAQRAHQLQLLRRPLRIIHAFPTCTTRYAALAWTMRSVHNVTQGFCSRNKYSGCHKKMPRKERGCSVSKIKAYLRLAKTSASRRSAPVNNWRGRPILYSGSPIISFNWAIHPTVRAKAKMPVNKFTGMPMARCTMPE